MIYAKMKWLTAKRQAHKQFPLPACGNAIPVAEKQQWVNHVALSIQSQYPLEGNSLPMQHKCCENEPQFGMTEYLPNQM